MATPHGPKPVNSSGQLVLPKEVLKAVGLIAGKSSVFVLENEAIAGTILVVPESMATEWFNSGMPAKDA